MSSRLSVCVLVCAAFCMMGASSPNVTAEYLVGWGDPILIESDEAWDAYEPEVAVDGQGNAIAVWYQLDGMMFSVFANRFEPGSGWLGAEQLDKNDVYSAYSPRIAMNEAGDAVVVWQEDNVTTAMSDIMMRLFDPGAGWDEPMAVETDHAWEDYVGDVAMDDEGNALIAWARDADPWRDVWACYYQAGLGLSSPVQVDDTDTQAARDPVVGMDGSGDATVVWKHDFGSVTSVWSARFTPDAGFSAPVKVGDSVYQRQPMLAVAIDGNATCAWSHQNLSTGRMELYAANYVLDEGWGPRQVIYQSGTYSATASSVAVDRHGNAILMWEWWSTTANRAVVNRFEAGVGWGPSELLLEAWSSIMTGGSKVAMTPTGDALVVFMLTGLDPVMEVWGMRYTEALGWGNPERICPDSLYEYGGLALAVNQAGEGMAVMGLSTGLAVDLWATRYAIPDTTPPAVSIDSPVDGSVTDSCTVVVSGTTEAGATLTVNGVFVEVGPDGAFSVSLSLTEGTNTIIATATDEAGNSAQDSVTVTFDDPTDETIQRLEDEISGLEEELASLSDELNSTRDALSEVNASLTDAVQETADALDEASSDLEDALDDLASSRQELSDANDSIDSLSSQVALMTMALIGLAVLAGILAVMHMLLRRAVAAPRSDTLPEDAPPPPE